MTSKASSDKLTDETEKLLNNYNRKPVPRSRLSQRIAYDTFGEHVVHEETERKKMANQTSDTFLRKTIKFWVLPSNFMAVKRRIARNGIREWRYDGAITENMEDSGTFCNSLYFDTNDFAMYDKRVLQVEKSMLFRYRWYSNNRCTKNGFFEQKIRRPSWRGEASIKQRFKLEPRLVYPFLENGAEVTKLDLKFVREMHRDTQLWGGKLHHCLRTQYRRTVFQEHNGAAVRMSFDEDVSLYDIKHLTWQQALDPSLDTESHKIFHFPLGILEVKLAFEKFEQIDMLEMPDWVYAMMNAGFIIQVEKFSKYCTGTAIMNLAIIHRVPSWVAAVRTLMEVELARKGREWFGAEKLPEWTIEENLSIPVRVEPREYMANERTLLKWVRMCYLALFVGFGLLGFEYEPTTGIVLIIMSMIILARAYYMYQLRLKALTDRNFTTTFYDPWGPPLLVAMFVLPTLTYLAYIVGFWRGTTR